MRGVRHSRRGDRINDRASHVLAAVFPLMTVMTNRYVSNAFSNGVGKALHPLD